MIANTNSMTLLFPPGTLGSVVSFFAATLCNFYLISKQIASIQIREAHLVRIGIKLTDEVSSNLDQGKV